MVPPKIGAPSQIAKKVQSSTRSPRDTGSYEENLNQPEGVVDVDSIPYPFIEPIITTIV